MPARGGNFQHPLGSSLPFYIAQVGVHRRGHVRLCLQGAPARVIGIAGGRIGSNIGSNITSRIGSHTASGQKLPHHIQQMAGTVNLRIGHQSGFFGARWRQHQRQPFALLQQSRRHSQRPAHRPQRARERQLARKHIAAQSIGPYLPAGSQNTQRNRQIKPPRIFGQIGRRKVYRNALVMRKLQPAVLNGATHPFTRLFHLGIGQPHQRKTGQAIGQMHLHRNGRRIKPNQGTAGDKG